MAARAWGWGGGERCLARVPKKTKREPEIQLRPAAAAPYTWSLGSGGLVV